MHPKEIENVLTLTAFERYQYLIKRIADQENVYTLQDEANIWASSQVKEHELYPIWSATEFVEHCLTDVWSNMKILKVDIYTFLGDILPLIETEGLLINAFPTIDRTGFVVTIDEFKNDINEELNQYL
jgi:hypothetical protein